MTSQLRSARENLETHDVSHREVHQEGHQEDPKPERARQSAQRQTLLMSVANRTRIA